MKNQVSLGESLGRTVAQGQRGWGARRAWEFASEVLGPSWKPLENFPPQIPHLCLKEVPCFLATTITVITVD